MIYNLSCNLSICGAMGNCLANKFNITCLLPGISTWKCPNLL